MNSFLTVWTKPDKTAQNMIDNKSIWYGVFIILLSSLGTSVFVFMDNGLLADFSLSIILLISILTTLISSVIFYFINAGIYLLISKMLGGRGKFREVALAIASGSLPLIGIIPIAIIALFLYGDGMYAELVDPFALTNMSGGFYALYMIVLTGLSIFGLVILSRSLGYANDFSALRGFGVVLIYAAVLFALVFVLVIIAVIVGVALVGI